MKILQVIDQLEIGGAEKVFIDMTNILFQYNVSVEVLFLREGGPGVKQIFVEIKKTELNRTFKWSISKMKECASILSQYDLIHCHFRHVYRYVSIVDKIFRLRKRIVFQDHYGSIDIDKEPPLFFDSILKPRYYIGVSQTLTSWAKKTLNIEDKRVYLLKNIIRKSDKRIERLGIELVLVSNIKKIKNNIFAASLAMALNKSLLIIGKNQDAQYFSALQKIIKGWPIHTDSSINEVQPVLKNFKLGLHTSFSETGPLVLIEYLAQGLPFLAYETGEVAKILKPYFPEYFIDNFDHDQWKLRIEILLTQTPDYDLMNKVFNEHFGEEQYYKKLNSIYQCIAAS